MWWQNLLEMSSGMGCCSEFLKLVFQECWRRVLPRSTGHRKGLGVQPRGWEWWSQQEELPEVNISKREQTLGKVQSWNRPSVIVSHIYYDDSKADISKACGRVDCWAALTAEEIRNRKTFPGLRPGCVTSITHWKPRNWEGRDEFGGVGRDRTCRKGETMVGADSWKKFL